jgi:hypothetical protein
MTYTINTADYNGCNPTKEVNDFPVFTQSNPPEYCGYIHRIAAWQVPQSVHQQLGLRDNLDLYITSKGHWAPTLENAEHGLVNTPPAQSFICKGATLSFFVPPQWAEDNGNPNAHDDYRVFRTAAGGWDAEGIYVSRRPVSLVGLAEVF